MQKSVARTIIEEVSALFQPVKGGPWLATIGSIKQSVGEALNIFSLSTIEPMMENLQESFWSVFCVLVFLYVLFALSFGFLDQFSRRKGFVRWVGVVLLMTSAWFVGAMGLLPVDWIVPIHVVGAVELPDMLLGKAVHCGKCWLFLSHLSPEGVAPLRIVVAANLFFAVLNIGFLFHFSRRTTHSALQALFFTALFATLPTFRITAFSEFPTQFTIFLTFFGAASIEKYASERSTSVRRFLFVFFNLLAVTILATLTRQEFIVPGMLTLVVFAFVHACGVKRIEAFHVKCREVLRGVVSLKLRSILWVAVVVLGGSIAFGIYWTFIHSVAIPFAKTWTQGMPSVWLVDALHVFSGRNPEWFTFGETLKAVLLVVPPGFGLFAALGAIVALFRWNRWLFLPVSCAFLVVLYFSAGARQLHDLLRLFSMLLGMFILFGLLGFGVLEKLLQRLGKRTGRIIALAIFTSFFVIDYPSWQEMLESPQAVSETLSDYHSDWLLDSDNQYIVRYMLDVADRNPTCTYAQTARPFGQPRQIQNKVWQLWNLRNKFMHTLRDDGDDSAEIPTWILDNKDCLIYVHLPEADPDLPARWKSRCLTLKSERVFRARPYQGGLRVSIPPQYQGEFHRLATYEVDTSREECLTLPKP